MKIKRRGVRAAPWHNEDSAYRRVLFLYRSERLAAARRSGLGLIATMVRTETLGEAGRGTGKPLVIKPEFQKHQGFTVLMLYQARNTQRDGWRNR